MRAGNALSPALSPALSGKGKRAFLPTSPRKWCLLVRRGS